MKLLHTSDWHLGARLGRHDRMPDHAVAIRALLEVAATEEPDLIVHSGDLFDLARPSYAAMRMGVKALHRLARVAPTVIVAGNHDSRGLFHVLDEMAAAGDLAAAGEMAASGVGAASGPIRRLWFVTEPRVLRFNEIAAERVALAAVPFILPGAVANYASDDPSRFEGNYADGIRTVNRGLLTEARNAVGSTGIVLYSAHLHVDGARPGTSERRFTVGRDYATHTAGLEDALYCAFGHIHDPQALPGGSARGRYAGSLIPLDFAEIGKPRHAVLVDIGHDLRVREVELPTGRRMVNFRGTLDQLGTKAQGGALDDCLFKGTVTSHDPIPELADMLASWSPRCAVFDLVNEVANRRAQAITGSTEETDEEMDTAALFAQWRETAARGVKAGDAEVLELFNDLWAGVGGERAPDLGATELAVRVERTLDALGVGLGQQTVGVGLGQPTLGVGLGQPTTERSRDEASGSRKTLKS